MAFTKLRLEHCDFTYEGLFAQPMFTLTDAPGRLADALLDILGPLGCSGPDLEIEDEGFASRGVTCEIGELDATVSLYGDRAELHCGDFRVDSHDGISEVLNNLWPRINTLAGHAVPKTISFRFDFDSQIIDGTYQQVLSRLAPPPSALPTGTESAVVYYMPPDPRLGSCDSSLVLNRSEIVDRGLQLSGTLVYEGTPEKPATLAEAMNRLGDLMRMLGLEWS